MGVKEISLSDFQSKLGSLRYSDYYGIITEIPGDLGLPETTTLEEMESLLIKAAKDCFDDTIEGDIALMALGLMKGFCHHEVHGKAKKEFPIKKRRIKFLNESSYLVEEYGGLYVSYEDIEKAGSKVVKQVFDKLGKTEDRCLNKVATKIYRKNIERLKEHMPTQKIALPDCKSVLLSDGMAVQANNIKNAGSAGNTASIKGLSDTMQSEGYTYRTEDINAGADGGTFVRKQDNVTIQVNINNAGFIPKSGGMDKNLPPVEYIFVPVEAISLEPLQSYAIKTAILPKEAQGAFLSYVSSDTSIATISADGIVMAKESCGDAEITIQAESGCTIKVPVSVRQKNNATQKRYGWGPKRPTYTIENVVDHATFNSITNNPVLGDERDFVRIVEVNSGNTFTNMLEIEPDKQYAVYIYYHNNASETYNDKEHKHAGVARDVRVASSFPDKLNAGEYSAVTGIIIASKTIPPSVWDAARITAKQDVTLHYVTGSAKIYNQWDVNGRVLSTKLFSRQGVFIGLNELNGVILGGGKYSGQIIYKIQTRPIKDT